MQLTVKGLLFRFFLIYLAMLVITVLTLKHFDITSNKGINIGVFSGITAFSYNLISQLYISFRKRNGRYFTTPEKILTVAGIVTINLLMQLMLILIPGFSSTFLGEHGSSFAFNFACTGLLQAALIYYLVASGNKTIQVKI